MSHDDVLRILLEETASGNVTAFGSLYDELSTETFTICIRILGSPDRAERAMEELWLFIWKHAHSLALSPRTARLAILAEALVTARERLSDGSVTAAAAADPEVTSDPGARWPEIREG